jgi:hypothetical protein
LEPILDLQILNQLWLALMLLVPVVLIARAVVTGTRYSPILIIVIFGLVAGFLLVEGGVSRIGLPEFPIIGMVGGTAIIALAVVFFVGGQELRKLFGKMKFKQEEMIISSQEETFLGTMRTQLVFIIQALLLLLGIEALERLILGVGAAGLSKYYPLIVYICLAGAVILIDSKASITDKRLYFKKGIVEIIGVVIILVLSYWTAVWIKPIIPLPQIFFVMIGSVSLGAILYKWRFGPTIKSLLFAGIPVVLAGNFLVGGSRISEVFAIVGMHSVIAYGFFGQILWMFGGIALLIVLGKANHVRNLAPGMAGSLSHAGLTGACTAGDFGTTAANRAPIMINIPFFGHVFVFSILAASIGRGSLMLWPSLAVVLGGIILTIIALKTLRKANDDDDTEVKGLMQFSFGWQLCAMFGGLLLLHFAAMPLAHAAMSQSSALSHFGLFAALHGGMFGPEGAELIPFIFAMPFLVHPMVFFTFGKAMGQGGKMSEKLVFALTIIGFLGVIYALAAL